MVTLARFVLLTSALACVYAATEEGDSRNSFPVPPDDGQGENETTRGSMEEGTVQKDGAEIRETSQGVEEPNEDDVLEEKSPTMVKEEDDGYEKLQEMFQQPSVGQPPLRQEGQEQPSGETEAAAGKSKPPEKPIIGYVPELPSRITKPGFLNNGTWYIMFYAAWCEHSKAAMPEFLEVIQRVVDQNLSTIYMGKIEVTKNSEVAKHFEIKSTPTFLLFRNAQKYKFEEEIKADNLFNFMRRVMTGEVIRVNSTEELAELRAAHPILFFLAHDSEVDNDWQNTYLRIAHGKIAKGKFAYTTDAAVVEEFKPPSMPSLMVFKGESVHFFREMLAAYTVSRWITLERFEDFAVVNTTTLRHYLKPATGHKLAILVVSEDPASRRIAQKKAIEVVKKVALSRQQHHHYQFLLLEGAELIENLLQTKNLHLPMLVVYEPYRTFYYVYDSKAPMTDKAIREFLSNITAGDIEPLGGPSYRNTVIYYAKIAMAIVKTMLTHQPVLSAATGLCLVAVTIFYLYICCYRSKHKEMSAYTRAARARAKEAALRAKKARGKGGAGGGGGGGGGGNGGQNGVPRRRGRGKENSGSNNEHSDSGEPELDKDK